ncbi:MAG: hypothetical protein NTZ84_03705 [Candidatus Nealsonbacteria bacterium]|nr:hypothetical protein [Candidatus Nealsonbacteria bacterium]
MTFYEADKSLTEQFIQINKTLRKLFLKIAKEEGYTLIFDTTTSGFAYVDQLNSANISEKVAKTYDAQSKWWLKSGGWDKDIKINDKIKGGFSVRDIVHTVLVREDGKFDLIIEKGIIFSDRSQRKLKKGEICLNKGLMNGFARAAKKAEIWLESRCDYDPCEIDAKKAYEQGIRFDMVGVGFFIETVDHHGWELRIRADVVGIPK